MYGSVSVVTDVRVATSSKDLGPVTSYPTNLIKKGLLLYNWEDFGQGEVILRFHGFCFQPTFTKLDFAKISTYCFMLSVVSSTSEICGVSR